MTASPESIPTEVTPETKDQSQFLTDILAKLAEFGSPEEKIAYGVEVMKGTIAQEGSPRFKEFWEVRKALLPFFKENLGAVMRSKLWAEYVELTSEARRLKEILEEQSVFAMEQIELAINGVEADLKTPVASDADIVGDAPSETIRKRAAHYNEIQRELNFLNTLAGRLTSLRKEVMKTDMRIRFKTKFFKRLSELGDAVFPKRKELIEKVSAEFEQDVEQFVAKHFTDGTAQGAPYYALREEIKALQSTAKLFTLNSGAFTRTRLKLSECWDKVKELEKEYKKEALEKKMASSEQRAGVQSKIDALKEKSATMSLGDLNQEIEAISAEMRKTDLHREDVRFLRDELYNLRAPHLAEQEKRAQEAKEAERERARLRKEALDTLKEEMNTVDATLSSDALLAKAADFEMRLGKLDVSKMEKQQLTRRVRSIKDQAAEKNLESLSDDEKNALSSLKAALAERKLRRNEIKEQIEQHRKALGSSSLDFEKAIHYQELMDEEKQSLEKVNAGIEEIEAKIREL